MGRGGRRPVGDLATQWSQVRANLSSELDTSVVSRWLSHLALICLRDGTIVHVAPNPFIRDRVRMDFAGDLQRAWTGVNPDVRAVEILCSKCSPAEARRPEESVPPAAISRPAPMAILALSKVDPAPETAGSMSAPLDRQFVFEEFVVGKSNELAYAAARRVAEQSEVKFNPLYLYGGVGLGKTHLMHAIAWEIRRRDPKRKVIYLSAEQFMYRFITALRYKDTISFKQEFRSVDVLMIDDLQFIAGKESTQEEFFHTLNSLIDHNRQVIISADRSPQEMEEMEERIRSRLGWGLVADIHPTDYELRMGILQVKAEALRSESPDLEIPTAVFEFLASKITSNIRELEGSLNRVVANAALVGRKIDMDMIQDVLKDILRATEKRVTIDEIQRKVAEHYNIRLADMHSQRRARAVARPRQVAMYLAKQLTTRSLPEIGRKFGGRDHTTVIHAVRRVEELVSQDIGLNEDVELLRRMLGGGVL